MSETPHVTKSAVPTAVILGIVALSVVLFFVFTLPYFRDSGDAPIAADPPAANAESAAAPAPAAPSKPTPPEEKKQVTAAPAVPSASGNTAYPDSGDLVEAFAAAIDAGNPDAALAIIGGKAIDGESLDRLRALISQGGFKAAKVDPFVEIGRLNANIRYALNLVRPGQSSGAAEKIEVLIDVTRPDAGAGWQIAALHLPAFSVPGAPADSSGPAPSKADAGPRPIVVKSAATRPDDPLMLAHEFVNAVINQDFAKAKSLVDGELVSEEKLAGLFIVTEEGGFRRKAEDALIATAAREDAAWVIAQMANGETGADFGLEIVKSKDDSGNWKIAALNLDRLLQARARMTDVDDVTYTPIVKNPKGGDSLVLYFGYDEGALHERSVRQLEIVAGILMGDPEKKIMIAGHADAKGPEGYNHALSDERAAAVRRGLLDAGVAPSQIVTRSYGELKPISPNIRPDGSDNPDGRKRNRRAEVYLNF